MADAPRGEIRWLVGIKVTSWRDGKTGEWMHEATSYEEAEKACRRSLADAGWAQRDGRLLDPDSVAEHDAWLNEEP